MLYIVYQKWVGKYYKKYDIKWFVIFSTQFISDHIATDNCYHVLSLCKTKKYTAVLTI